MEHQLVDPEGCPRDREEAASTGRQCLRKCQSDGECISSRKRCLCDGLCGWSCVRPDLHCDELTAIENGQFKVTGDHFGARVHYTCDEAFWMSGSKERVCQGDGSWSDRSPECRRKAMCGAPPQILHARHNGTAEKDEYDVDALVDYTCFPGYDASGYSRAKCLFHNGTTQWFGLELRCIPRSCGIPGEVENGRREGDLFTFTSRVTYHCLDGYELVGRANRYCQSNGEWSGVLPSCRPIECPIPANPPNGRALFTVVSYNSVVKYDCKYGYRLAGQVTRTCGPNKQWEGSDPVCEEIDCGNPGELYNGHLKGSNTRLGAVLLFRCLDDMVMEGDYISTTCLQDGTWSHPLPKCLAPCTVPEIDYGRVNEMAPGSKVNHGENITVDCIPHYDLRYNVTPAICNNGTWTHKPTCVPARCKKLPKRPLNGMVIAPKTDHGMKALFRCNDGYELEGPNVTECNFGRWSVQTPACNVVYCKFPGYLENGRILLVGHMGMYDYRPYVKKVPNDKQVMYECNRHYTLSNGPSGATCVAGKWSPKELPQCVKGSHPNVRWIRSVRNRREKAIRRFQRQDINRFRRNKFGRKKQRRTKDWCPLIDNVPWMRISIVKMGKGNEDVPHGTVVRAQCYRGYLLNIGNRTARCVRGKWKPMEPQCVTYEKIVEYSNKNCTFKRTDQNLVMFIGDRKLAGDLIEFETGTEIIFRCRDIGKYQLRGSIRLRCRGGKWDGIPPICIGLSQESDYALEKPPTILFRHRLGEIAQSNEGKLLVYPGTILHLECLWIRKYGTPRWEIRTSANRKYPEGWTNEPGRDPQLEYRLSIYHAQRSDSGIYTCITPMNHRHSINILVIAIDCPPVPQIYGLYTNTNKRMMNTKLVFHCEEPKNLIGSEKATCLPSGRWSAPFPHCIATECPDPSKVTSPPMKIISDGFKIGKTARFSCPKGSILKGSDKITCLDTGQWSAPIPYCTKETCEPPELPIHGHVIGNKSYVYRHGDMLLIGCDEGYMADGPIVLVCQEDGRWSSDKPQCLPVCSYPGSTEGAILSPVKFYYTVNETVIFECLNGYKMKGSKIIQCLKDGKWSSSIPTCESLESNQ
ncbi:protein lev-9-like isoform X4 [Centruroides sculpturatus]|uniref:protein lev-9-like isoform X4 n=1 Tax=Centruroides sculpturatus TaxID=218467 RepID=UPI000C6CFA37|nr:protein lev-9-like isoform X4 [Centruroides sculpturatus]